MNEELKGKILHYNGTNKRNQLVYITKTNTIIADTNASRSDNFLNSQLYKDIINATHFLPITTSIQTRTKLILLDITNIPKCPICGKNCSIRKELKTNSNFPVFSKTCGDSKCIAKIAGSKSIKNEKNKLNHRIAQTNHKKHLLECYTNLYYKYVQNDFIPLPLSEVKRIIETRLCNVKGNASLTKENDFIDMNFLLSVLHYTNFIPLENGDIKSKSFFSFNERMYCILNDIKSIPLCKYCGSHLKFVSFKKGGYQTNCSSCWTDNLRERIAYPTLNEMKNTIDETKYEIISFPTLVTKEQLIIKCKKCGTISKRWLFNGRGTTLNIIGLCDICDKYSSVGETELYNFISSLTLNVQKNVKSIISPYELDIYIPEKNIAIEFDGLYWHSVEQDKNKNYHLMKTKMCEEQGIHLIHIFENEWICKQDIVKFRIKNLLGIYDNVVYARKCIVKEIDYKTSSKFIDENHIQGKCSSSINLGLYYENELVSVMTFSKTRFSKKHEYELLRFCNKLGYHIPGSASKLLTYFERKYSPKSLVSYADRRWSTTKNIYKVIGFNQIGISKPNYWYFKHDKRFVLESRIKFQKHKLKDILEKYDETLSESQNMKNNGYFKIFDCGNFVFEKFY